jgi:hypothetical protein
MVKEVFVPLRSAEQIPPLFSGNLAKAVSDFPVDLVEPINGGVVSAALRRAIPEMSQTHPNRLENLSQFFHCFGSKKYRLFH